MQKKLFVYSAFIAIMMLSGCTLEPLDAYEGTPCPNVHRLITKIDYGLPNGTHVEVYCSPNSIDFHDDGTCDDYITHDFIDDTVSHDAEGQMIFALNSGLCPKSYLCQDNGTCVKSLCNGFNTNLDSDNANCGKCGNTCGNGTTCSNGVCIVADKSKVLCNGEFINPENDPRYCGARGDCKDDSPVSWNYRGIICQGATPVCSNGRCVSACVGGQIVCDGRCVDPMTDNAYCGARWNCKDENAGEKCMDGRICSGGSCGVTCVSGQILCNGQCIDPTTDNRYCGATGDCSNYTACPSGTVCSGGICDVTCPSGQILCHGQCIDPTTDNRYCGATGDCSNYTACPSGTVCSGGTCNVTCVSDQILCNGQCIDPKSDNRYCGASGNCIDANSGSKCKDGEVCSGGKCGITCVSGQIVCNGQCIDPNTDNRYCGAKDRCTESTKCKDGEVCSDGKCGITCVSGHILCNGQCIDPTIDNRYCGARGDCIGFNAGEKCADGRICSGGSCGVTCVSGQILCNGQCIDPTTDNRYCGAKWNCSGVNAGSRCREGKVCSDGICGITCVSSQIVCNGQCIDPKTDNRYCGASGSCSGTNSGNQCVSGQVCSNGECGITCVSSQIVCGGQCIDPETDNRYCGAKGACNNANSSNSDYKGEMCTDGRVCINGICTLNCPSRLLKCGSACIDPNTNGTYCGAKGACNNYDISSADFYGFYCGHNHVCLNGACVLNSCDAPLVLCSTTTGNQCININETDKNNCGACGYKCADHPVANAVSEKCIDGRCIYECKTGYANQGTGNTASEILCVGSAS